PDGRELDDLAFACRQIAGTIGPQMMQRQEPAEALAGEMLCGDHRLGVEGEVRTGSDDACLIWWEGMHGNANHAQRTGQARLLEEGRFLQDAKTLLATSESKG